MFLILWGLFLYLGYLFFEFKNIHDELKEIKKILTKK